MAFRAAALKNALDKPPTRLDFHHLDMENAFILSYTAPELKVMAAKGRPSN